METKTEAKTKKPATKKKAEDNGGNDRYEGFISNIHGKDYVGVDGRVKVHQGELLEKELQGGLNFTEVFWKDGETILCQVRAYSPLHGYGEATAGAYGKSPIDKSNPYENAETSAWGRLLGFWGYGLLGGGIASAEEVVDAKKRQGPQTADKKGQSPDATISEKQVNLLHIWFRIAKVTDERKQKALDSFGVDEWGMVTKHDMDIVKDRLIEEGALDFDGDGIAFDPREDKDLPDESLVR